MQTAFLPFLQFHQPNLQYCNFLRIHIKPLGPIRIKPNIPLLNTGRSSASYFVLILALSEAFLGCLHLATKVLKDDCPRSSSTQIGMNALSFTLNGHAIFAPRFVTALTPAFFGQRSAKHNPHL
jgi:hypothetical protein